MQGTSPYDLQVCCLVVLIGMYVFSNAAFSLATRQALVEIFSGHSGKIPVKFLTKGCVSDSFGWTVYLYQIRLAGQFLGQSFDVTSGWEMSKLQEFPKMLDTCVLPGSRKRNSKHP